MRADNVTHPCTCRHGSTVCKEFPADNPALASVLLAVQTLFPVFHYSQVVLQLMLETILSSSVTLYFGNSTVKLCYT